MLQDVNANLVCNDKILMQVGIETVRNSILLWLPIEQGGMGYADNFHSQALIYLDREQVVIPRKGIGEVVFGDHAGATGVISWLGVGGAIYSTRNECRNRYSNSLGCCLVLRSCWGRMCTMRKKKIILFVIAWLSILSVFWASKVFVLESTFTTRDIITTLVMALGVHVISSKAVEWKE